jgi:predicted transcriptional regulator
VNLSKQKVGEVVAELIGKNLVARPKGSRKGATLTQQGIALLDRIRKSSANHP